MKLKSCHRQLCICLRIAAARDNVMGHRLPSFLASRLTSPVNSGLVAGSAGTALGLMTFMAFLLGITRLDTLLEAPGGWARHARHLGIVVAQFDVVVHQRCYLSPIVVVWSALWVTVPTGGAADVTRHRGPSFRLVF